MDRDTAPLGTGPVSVTSRTVFPSSDHGLSNGEIAALAWLHSRLRWEALLRHLREQAADSTNPRRGDVAPALAGVPAARVA